jgi:hypothetical protein
MDDFSLRLTVWPLPNKALPSFWKERAKTWLESVYIEVRCRAPMNAVNALAEQIRRYRRMTGEERLGIALDLHELACDIAREGIRRQSPQADPQTLERLLRRRLELARSDE